jgi:hypothetical protein
MRNRDGALGLASKPAPPLAFRMADFAAFGGSLFALRGRTSDWTELLAILERAQAGFAAQNDGLVEVLRISAERGPNRTDHDRRTGQAMFEGC